MKTTQPNARPGVLPILAASAVAFVLVLLWGAGFDWLCRQLHGGMIKAALNWLSNTWVWFAWAFGAVVVVVSFIRR